MPKRIHCACSLDDITLVLFPQHRTVLFDRTVAPGVFGAIPVAASTVAGIVANAGSSVAAVPLLPPLPAGHTEDIAAAATAAAAIAAALGFLCQKGTGTTNMQEGLL